MTKNSDLERLREETEARQRAVLWPDMLRSGRDVDEFLWKGAPNATRIQRAGFAFFGVFFLFFAALGVLILFKSGAWSGRLGGLIIVSIGGIVGVRMMRNAFQGSAQRGRSR